MENYDRITIIAMMFKIYIFYYWDSNFEKLLFETRAVFHCHNEYIRYPSSRTLFYIIKRIYDNNNYNCYQWIKSKYGMVTFVCRRYHITCRFSTSSTPTTQCYSLWIRLLLPTITPTPSAPYTAYTIYCAHSPTAATTSFRTWLISMGFRFGMESRRRTVSCRTYGSK